MTLIDLNILLKYIIYNIHVLCVHATLLMLNIFDFVGDVHPE